MALSQLIYTSYPAFPIRPGSLTGPLGEIMNAGREHNSRNQISGILGVEVNRFFQILEGPPAKVLETFDRIQHDRRHFGVQLKHVGELEVRTFKDWSIGFAAPAFLPSGEPAQIDFDTVSVQTIINRGLLLRRCGVIAEAGLETPSASGF
ncbi:BLUF domain-containing protein [Oceanicaulis alexandrii]|uniref:BLUF domain-containing protein n=1 Tax=Oceanicaulis alexandrii TaxID=153233 RepID=UPI0035CF7FBE